ncbi:glycosyltransferase [Acerihabitans sp. KWT182]|uniref:Glycosyltransferase n=1 Tax=Acerihabitans sp. KWT182 TaxID=3157919 RepID=A0AAU7Q6Q0_9GAMM
MPRAYAISPAKAPRRDYNAHGIFIRQNEIRVRNDGKATSVIYDLTHNVFYLRHDKTKVKTIIEQFPEKTYSIDPAGRLKKATVPSPAPAAPSEQYTGIQALGVDLKWDSAPIKLSPETKHSIPRKITSIWVGKNDISDDIVRNLQNNALQAKEFPRPHDFKLYLSSRDEGAYQRNMERLQRLAKNVVVINLEFTDYYHAFSQTKNYDHYLAAIDGNGGKATNFASACDVIRLDLLNRRGGLYMDVDDTLFIPPGTFELKTHPEGLILSTPVYHDALNVQGKYPNSNWGTHANNPTLAAMLEESYQRYLSHRELYRQRPPLLQMSSLSAAMRPRCRMSAGPNFSTM